MAPPARKAWMPGSRLRQGFAVAFPCWRAEALAEAASPGMTTCVARTPLEPRPVPRFHLPMFTVFRGGQSGAWRVTRFAPVKGASLARTAALSSVYSASIAPPILPSLTSWRLAAGASHVRYTQPAEHQQLAAL